MATLDEQQERKVKLLFELFDEDGDGRLNREEMAKLVRGVNPSVKFADEQILAILDEVFRQYGDFIDDVGLSFEGLMKTYQDGAGDVDRDFGIVGLELPAEEENTEEGMLPVLPDPPEPKAAAGEPPEEKPVQSEVVKALIAELHQVLNSTAPHSHAREKALKDLRSKADRFGDINDTFEAHMEMGYVLGSKGEYGEAKLCFERATKIKNDARAHFRLGNALFALDQLYNACRAYKEALDCAQGQKDSSLMPKIRVNLGITNEAMGMLMTACEHYNEAIMLKPDHHRALKLLGSARYALGDLSLAEGHLQHALHLDPDFADARCDLGCTLCSQGRLQDAKVEFERALRSNPRHLEAIFNLGNVHRQCGEFQAAIDKYNQVLDIEPRHWRTLLNRAVAELGLGKRQQAHQSLQAAFAQSGRRVELYDEIKQLKRLGKSADLNQMLKSLSSEEADLNGRGYRVTRHNGRRAKAEIREIESMGFSMDELTRAVDLQTLPQLTHFANIKLRDLRNECKNDNLQGPGGSTDGSALVKRYRAEAILRNILSSLGNQTFQVLMRTINHRFIRTIDPVEESEEIDLSLLFAALAMLVDAEYLERKQEALDILRWGSPQGMLRKGRLLQFGAALKSIYSRRGAGDRSKVKHEVFVDETPVDSLSAFESVVDDRSAGFPYSVALPRLTRRHGWAT